MTERIKISTDKNDRESGYVQYRIKGVDTIYISNFEEWKVYELKNEILKHLPEDKIKLVGELESAVRDAVYADQMYDGD